MYTWIVIAGGIFCVAMAWGIGANDVANFFGPAVGARSISLKRAMIIAFIFEFIGAFFLGSTVTNTIRKKIVAFDEYNNEADVLLLGMFSALTAAAIWVYLATKYSLPVSTTQSIVGAIIGFVTVSKGPKAVEWEAVTNIIIFWVATPVMGCVACLLFYVPSRHLILSKDDSYAISSKSYPLFVFVVVFIMSTFLLFKGFKRFAELGEWSETNPFLVVLIGMGAGLVFALIAYFVLVRTGFVKRYAERSMTKVSTKGDIEMNGIQSTHVSQTSIQNTDEKMDAKGLEKGLEKDNKMMVLTSGLNVDVFDGLSKAESDLQKYSTQFDERTERLFEWLSVLAATFGVFAHGSNDIANAVAPFSSIVTLSQQKPGDTIESKNDVPVYVLLLGSIFMSIGCVTYGYNVIKTMGVKLTKLSPSRGYFTQVAAATVIIVASNYGFPASTTHAQTGATVAIGLVEKMYNPDLKWNQVFNWRLLFTVFLGWIATILIAGLSSALIFSAMAYSPCA